MKCIYCTHKKTEVTNSREIKNGLMTWRRRLCQNCKKIFTTKESAVADNLFVIKRNGSRQRFIYEKLFSSIFVVINARKNRDNGEDAKNTKRVAEKITARMFSVSNQKEILSKTIVELVYKELKKVSTAYADSYISYSDYRFRIGLQFGLIKIPDRYR